ncbi:SpoIIE family protein phosphatase [Porphyromonadaceae bacterium OttesenSCG-928-L07]|nr:SpoIIE family protein phosphatase [Porphyromonadaceae bacterium OttesenSCG-928-L07]MDL2330799.1 SpoIIE family protein phosphatase [Odoribacter sp. OttesenSCG-928-A06]
MRNNGNFIEVEFFQKNKAGNIVCGDCFMSKKLKGEGRVISVLSDGLGSGIKASVLSTMTASMAINFTAMNESIITASTSIMNTLPRDMVRKISYSTFSICDIDCFGNVKIIEYEAPSFYLYRNGRFKNIPKERLAVERTDLDNTFLWISEFTLEKEDRIIFFSDGVSQSGMGSPNMPFGWENGVQPYILGLIEAKSDISAKSLAKKIVSQAEKNDGYSLKDDTSCCVIYMRKPRNLLICTGPPYEEKNDKYLSNRVKEFSGKKVLCGGTTASIVSRELETELEIDMDIIDKDLPPVSKMEGIDLITEGILTLSKVERLLSLDEKDRPKNEGPAETLIKLLLNSDKITWLVGTRINTAHQDPNLPVELEIRRNVVKKIKHLLETKYLKDVEITYI